MNVGEVIEMLSLYNPKDDLVLITTTKKIGHITGINDEMSRNKECIVIKCEWDEAINARDDYKKKVDIEIEKLESLKRIIDEKGIVPDVPVQHAWDAMEQRKDVNEVPESLRRKKITRVGKKKLTRSLAEKICAGEIPSGGKGRPKKIDVKRLSVNLRLMLTPEKVEAMSTEELNDLLVKIRKEMHWKKL